MSEQLYYAMDGDIKLCEHMSLTNILLFAEAYLQKYHLDPQVRFEIVPELPDVKWEGDEEDDNR